MALLEQNISGIFMYIKIKIVVLKGMHLAKVYSIPILQQYFKKNFVYSAKQIFKTRQYKLKLYLVFYFAILQAFAKMKQSKMQS